MYEPLLCLSKADLSVTYVSTEYLEDPFIAAQCNYYRRYVSVYPVVLQSTLAVWQCLKYGGITIHLGSDKIKKGAVMMV